jgi:hypothetical protein
VRGEGALPFFEALEKGGIDMDHIRPMLEVFFVRWQVRAGQQG